MDTFGAELTAVVLSSLYECDVRVAAETKSVVAFHIPEAGYLIIARTGFPERDWDKVVRKLPDNLWIDYAADGWSVTPPEGLFCEALDIYFATLDIPRQRTESPSVKHRVLK